MFHSALKAFANPRSTSRSRRDRWRRTPPAAAEVLESRILPSASSYVANGVLNVLGTTGDDEIHVFHVDENGTQVSNSNQVRVQISDSDGNVLSSQTHLASYYLWSFINHVQISAYSGNDVISNETNITSTIYAGIGNDAVVGGSNNDLIYGGYGNDWIDGRGGNDHIWGQHGDDQLLGHTGNDVLKGGLGVDHLVGGAGADHLESNSRYVDYYDFTKTPIIHPVYGQLFELKWESNPYRAAEVLDGGIGNDTLLGGSGHDLLYGRADHDLLDAGYGVDVLDGGSGDDVLIDGFEVGFSQTLELIPPGSFITPDQIVSQGDGKVTYKNKYGNTFTSDLGQTEFLVTGKPWLSASDWMVGGDGNDLLYATGGRDTLFGVAGDDTLFGGDQPDRLAGGLGNDHLYGGAGADFIDGNEHNDLIKGGSGNDVLFGGQGADSIFGEAGDDHLLGESGNDLLDGGSGDDGLYGFQGDDILIGGTGNDQLWGHATRKFYQMTPGTIIVNSYGSYGNDYLDGGDGHDLLIAGDGHDWLFGGAGNDVLIAGGGNDFLFGESGEDWLYGGSQDDYLNGGTGIDCLFGGSGVDSLVDMGPDKLEPGDPIQIDQVFAQGLQLEL